MKTSFTISWSIASLSVQFFAARDFVYVEREIAGFATEDEIRAFVREHGQRIKRELVRELDIKLRALDLGSRSDYDVRRKE